MSFLNWCKSISIFLNNFITVCFASALSSFFNLLFKRHYFQKMKSVLTFSKWTKKMSKFIFPRYFMEKAGVVTIKKF